MLKYSIRLTDGQIEQQAMEWSERYLSPDLSFVSGVTSTSNGLSAFKTLSVESKAGNGSDVVNVNVDTVRRDGFIVFRQKAYKVQSGTTKNFVFDNGIDYQYVELNGKYYYYNPDGQADFHIDEWLVKSGNSVTVSSVTANMSGGIIRLDTIVWIENGKAVIDGNTYFVDKDENAVKFYENGQPLAGNQVCDCTSLYIVFTSPKYVDKFTLTKNEGRKMPFDSISFCAYAFHAIYKNVYCGVDVDNNGNVICNVPTRLINADDTTGYTKCQVYAYTDGETEGIQPVIVSDTPESGKTVISKLERLNGIVTYAKIINDYFPVSATVINTNGGEKALVYLTEPNNMRGINVGDKISFIDANYGKEYYIEEDDGKKFALIDGKKYFVEPDICSKALMNGHEYDIVEESGTSNVFVVVNGEKIPMIKSGDTLVTHSKIVTQVSGVTEAKYQINSYSGIVVGDETYIVKTLSGEGSTITEYIVYDGGAKYSLVVDGFFGGFGLICSADMSGLEFSKEYIDKMERNVVENVVLSQASLSLYTRNTIFGEVEITPSWAVNGLNMVPYSSDDYYSLTDDLVIYTNQKYISLPLSLDFKSAGDVLQDDIVENQFYMDELNKAINPIVDMERDVYIPKMLLDDKYSGSTANFSDIDEIQINLHFRTRDLDSWKVNEIYKNESKYTSDNTNWFVTDIEPYKSSRYVLDTVSELVGLMNFENADVYYQKSKIANSFLRFSYYDSINPQTQSLLHTSTVYMDEHALYKKYIDNSRNVNYQYKTVPFTEGEEPSNRISVLGEPVTGASLTAGFDDDGRLSSRFTIKSKYSTDTSSEGFYLYIFKEYGEKLYAKPIYLRIDFNHAGIGQTLPFMVPMAVDSNGNPTSALTLNNSGDVVKMKKGVSLSTLYQQIYIPIYCVYDFKHKEYGYIFDDRYVKVNGNMAVINLYELKIMDESSEMDTSTFILNYNTKFSGSIK